MTTEQALKEQIHTNWAYSKNESEKYKHNKEVYNAIKHLAKKSFVKSGYATSTYRVEPTSDIQLTNLQKALIADDGSLCFGYRMEGSNVVIHTD